MNYWDTSALLKIYVKETDSAYFLNLLIKSNSPLLTSSITQEEILCALYRKERSGDIKNGAADVLFKQFLTDESTRKIITIPKGKDVLIKAEEVVRQIYNQHPSVMIRSLDAIHLGSALASKASTMVTTDKRLKNVSLIMKLKVLP